MLDWGWDEGMRLPEGRQLSRTLKCGGGADEWRVVG
jgi:hypothetical protein